MVESSKVKEILVESSIRIEGKCGIAHRLDGGVQLKNCRGHPEVEAGLQRILWANEPSN
jgi:hypothetical protein